MAPTSDDPPAPGSPQSADEQPAPLPAGGTLHGEIGGTVQVRSRYLLILTVLAILTVCVVAKVVLVPVTAALILHAVLVPAVRWLGRRGVPAVVGATGLMLLMLGTLVGLGQTLYEPAAEWMSEMPYNAAQLEQTLGELRGSVEGVVRASKQVEEMTAIEDGEDEAVVVREQRPSLLSVVLGRATQIVSTVFITLTLLFLLLANERSLMRGTVRALSRSRDRRRAVRIAQGFQRDISYYLRAITLINIGLGIAVGLVLWWVGMPNPALWGVMACVLNFVPYVGMAVGVLIVGFVAATSFEESSLAHVLLAPGSYALLSSLEGGLLTPAILGRRLLVNPPIILVWLVLWGWMWGVAGALLAVPMLMAVKIFCEHVPSFRGVALFLSRDSQPEEHSSPAGAHLRLSHRPTGDGPGVAVEPDAPGGQAT